MTPPRYAQRDASPSPVDKKRARKSRSSSCSGPDDEHTTSDVEMPSSNMPDESTVRHGQAERKRELERNRRNLVNVRFAELEAELRRSVPRVDSLCGIPSLHSANLEKGKRIDKEAVLKEAAQRLALQRKELTSMCERTSSMTGEIDNLRAEKSELRDDKNYLRSELETVRGELQRLRSDNINLWQALRKATAFKDSFSPDVAKLPMELFLRSSQELNQQAAVSAPQSYSAGASTRAATLRQDAFSRQQFQIPDLDVNPLQLQQPRTSQPQQCTPQNQQAILLSQMETQATQEANARINASLPTNRTPNLLGNMNESFLVFQNAEELGDLFTNYAPGTQGALRQSQLAGLSADVGASNQYAAEVAASSPMHLTAEKNSGTLGSPNMMQFEEDNGRILQRNPLKAKGSRKPPEVYATTPSTLRDNLATEKVSEEPFPDVAPCV